MAEEQAPPGFARLPQCEVAGKILDHVRLPNDPEPVGDGVTLAYDVTGEPIGDWVVGTDPEPQGYERGPPPSSFDGVDPPCPDEYG